MNFDWINNIMQKEFSDQIVAYIDLVELFKFLFVARIR